MRISDWSSEVCSSDLSGLHEAGHRHAFDMLAALKSAWPLCVGLGMLMLGNGLQNSLLGIRAGQEAFTTEATGLIMACYYVGMLGGALATPKVVGNVGHVRVFAALASKIGRAHV